MPKVLFPTDYSAASRAVLPHAVAIARGMAAELTILHVAPAGFVTTGESSQAGATSEQIQMFAEIAVDLGDGCGVEYRHDVVEGDAQAEIIAWVEREGIDLVIMGTTGKTGLKRVLLGSVAEAVVRLAACPVLTLKAPVDDRPAPEHPEAAGELEQSLNSANAPKLVVPTDPMFVADDAESAARSLISRAITARASDVHLDPLDHQMSIRFRVDGSIREYCRVSREVGSAIATQLKVMANIDFTDHFHPHEGRIQLPPSLTGYEVRITTVPTAGGPAVSLRVISRDRVMRPLESLGFSNAAFDLVQSMLAAGEGIILVTGPTGSGKTTTAYSMLHALDNGSRNIVSIEDPVEIFIPHFRQVAVDPKHNVTMTSGLKTILRVDPDVVLVGEIRDREAAETAMRAASSGKYVFASLHTRDVAATVTALRDLNIDNRSLAGNLTGIISQRLIRRLCEECCQEVDATSSIADVFVRDGLEPPDKVREAVGCARCQGTGYYERIGIYEVALPNALIVDAIAAGAAEDDLRRMIRSQGTMSLQGDALDKVRSGITSFDEYRSLATLRM